MKISIITICYNSEKTLEDTLKSVLEQTYQNYEYLIIDGKSNDNTISIIKKYEKLFNGRLKYISEKDDGLYDAMNKGIELSTGDIIGFINSDDILAHENVFQNIINNIKDYDGIYSNLLMLDEKLKKPYRLFKSKRTSKKMGWHPPHPTLYLKKSIYQQYSRFNTQYKIAADLDFMLRIIMNDVKTKYLDDYFVFMRSGGASTNGLKGYYRNFKESYKVLKNNDIKYAYLINILRIGKTISQRIAVLQKKEIFRATHLSKKKKLIQINTVCNGSTGKIMGDIQRRANQEGYQTLSIYGRRRGYNDLNCKKIGGFFSFWVHVAITTIFDKQGYGSYFKTKKLIKVLRKEKSDIIHLHNIHGYYLNYPVLFKYLKKEYTGKLYWTFHDCWPFTGHCPYFTYVKCNKWKKQCAHCPNKKSYPISFFLDSSKSNYVQKKKYFLGLNNLTIITPSQWLNDLASQSFFKTYPIITIHNGINTNIYKKTIDKEIFNKYNIPVNKKIILGVASIWEKRKGLDDFIELSKLVDQSYQIVLVGLNKHQQKEIPETIIGILRTESQTDLVKLYSIADVFVNPTYEDNYPTVNLEALSCNTHVIAYDTGGCIEQIQKDNGVIIKKVNSSKENAKKIYKELSKMKKDFSLKLDLDKKTMENRIIQLYKGE